MPACLEPIAGAAEPRTLARGRKRSFIEPALHQQQRSCLLRPLPPSTYPTTFDAAAETSLEDLPYLPEGAIRKIRTLGEAIYGKVYLAEIAGEMEAGPGIGTGPALALKKMPRADVLKSGKGVECARNEIHASLAIRELQLPYSVKVLGAAQDDQFFYLATEYCALGELFSVLERSGRFVNEAVLREVICQVLLALRGLHRAGIAHRDVSMENVLVAEDGTVRLCDYGQAVLVHPPENEHLEARVPSSQYGLPGKPCYRAPEVRVGTAYRAKPIDTFACGVLLYTLAVGSYPCQNGIADSFLFPANDVSADRCTRMTTQLAHQGISEWLSPALVDLLEQMLAPCPEKRATIEDALAHPWLTGTLDNLWLGLNIDDAEESDELPMMCDDLCGIGQSTFI